VVKRGLFKYACDSFIHSLGEDGKKAPRLGLVPCFSLQHEYMLGGFPFSSKSPLSFVTLSSEIIQSPNIPDRPLLK
jgi:hypothetical protein